MQQYKTNTTPGPLPSNCSHCLYSLPSPSSSLQIDKAFHLLRLSSNIVSSKNPSPNSPQTLFLGSIVSVDTYHYTYISMIITLDVGLLDWM